MTPPPPHAPHSSNRASPRRPLPPPPHPRHPGQRAPRPTTTTTPPDHPTSSEDPPPATPLTTERHQTTDPHQHQARPGKQEPDHPLHSTLGTTWRPYRNIHRSSCESAANSENCSLLIRSPSPLGPAPTASLSGRTTKDRLRAERVLRNGSDVLQLRLAEIGGNLPQ